MTPPPPAPSRSRTRAALSGRARAGGSEPPTRSTKALIVSVLVHAAVAVVLVQVITFGHGLSAFLGLGKRDKETRERVTFVATRPVTPPPSSARRSSTPAAVSAPAASAPALVAPAETPIGVPAEPARRDTGSGLPPGRGVGAVHPSLKGVKPEFGDPRVWQAPGNGIEYQTQRNGAERLDSIIGYVITAARDSLDSLARAQGKYGKAPGDWTRTDKDGNKWGWDPTGIRLGKVTIPNALLALLPLNAQRGMSGNSVAIERERRLSASREDISRMAERSMGEVEFRKLADELRDRRERERRDRLRAPSAAIAPAAVPVAKPNEKTPPPR